MKKLAIVLAFSVFTLSASAQALSTEYLGRVVCDRLTVSDFRESDGYLSVLSRGWEGGGIIRMGKDGSNPGLLDGGSFDSFIDAGGRTLVWTSAGELLELDDSGPGLSLFATGIEVRDPPIWKDGFLWYAKEGKGLFRRAPGSADEILVSKAELIFATACSTGVAGWLREGEEFALTVVDPKTGKARTYLRDHPGFLVAHAGLLCYASFEGGVHAVDLETGKDSRLSDLRVEGKLVPAGRRLWAAGADDGGRLHAIDLDSGKDMVVSADRGCRVLAANASGIWYARRPGEGAGMVYGSGGNESLCFWSFDGKGNRERLFAGRPFSPAFLGQGWTLGHFPAEGGGLWAVSLSDFRRSLVAREAERLATAWTDGKEAFFISLGDAEEGPLARVPLSGEAAPTVLVPSCSAAWPAGESILFTRGEDSSLYILPPGGRERLLHAGEVWRAAWDGKRIHVLVEADGTYEIQSIDPEEGKACVVRRDVRPGMGQILVASGGILWYNDGAELRRYDPEKGSDVAIAAIEEGFVMGMAHGLGSLSFAVDNMGADGIYRVDDTGGRVTKMADGELFGLAVDGDSLYWFSDWVEKNENPDGASYAYRMRD